MRLLTVLAAALILMIILFVGLQALQLLNILICYEGLTLSLLSVFLLSGYMSSHTFYVFILLTFAICEASLGLALLTSFARANGNDYVMTQDESCS